jgi:single-strand DNA-binding protein
MSDIITLTGIVATTPNHLVTTNGLTITSFRLASGQRRFDRTQNSWVDAETNWYSVSTFRHLAHNVRDSVHKGEHVIVSGRLRIRQWENGDRKGTTVDIEADSVGHDLTWCTTRFLRSAPGKSTPVAPQDSDTAPEPDELASGDAWHTSFSHEESGEEAADDSTEQTGDGFLPNESSSLIGVVS